MRQQNRRRHRQRRSNHAANHDLEAQCFGATAQIERGGKPSGFVELDVDCVIAAAKIGQIVNAMYAFISAYRDWASDAA